MLYMKEVEKERFFKELREEKVYKLKRRKMLRAIKVLSCILVVLVSYVALNWR